MTLHCVPLRQEDERKEELKRVIKRRESERITVVEMAVSSDDEHSLHFASMWSNIFKRLLVQFFRSAFSISFFYFNTHSFTLKIYVGHLANLSMSHQT